MENNFAIKYIFVYVRSVVKMSCKKSSNSFNILNKNPAKFRGNLTSMIHKILSPDQSTGINQRM